jgi:hypothetical protein
VFAPALPVTETFTIIGPTITGIHPAGSSAATIQAGSWASIYGNNLATAVTNWDQDFPVSPWWCHREHQW